MTFTQLVYFVNVVKYNSITQAAKKIFVSQPAISNAIKELEEEFHTTFFVRNNNQLSITEEGLYFYNLASELIQKSDDVESKMKEYVEKSETLKIGIPPMLGSFIISPILKQFSKVHPNIQIQVSEYGSVNNKNAIIEHEINIGVTVTEKGQISNAYNSYKLGETSLLFAINKNNPLSKKEVMTISDIKDTPIILMKEDCLQHSLVKEAFAREGIVPNIMITTNQLYTIMELLHNNNLGAFVFDGFFKPDSDISGIPFKNPITLDIVLIWNKDAPLNDLSKEFMEFMIENKELLKN